MTDVNIKQAKAEHPFAPFVRILGKGKKGSRSLTEQEAFEAMNMILKGEVEDVQLGAFLMLLRVKEESAEELSGFVKAVKEQLNTPAIAADLDWSSYAGKRRHLPWYLPAIFLLAQAGYRVMIHGASGHTANRLYTENILNELGIPVSRSWEEVADSMNVRSFAYLPLDAISPRLAEMINMRHLMGLRSPVHSLSRLINPLNADSVLQGIFHPPYSGLHQEAGALLGYRSLSVIKGEGGEIERNPDNAMVVKSAIKGELTEEEWPSQFERRHVKGQDLTVNYLKQVWRGEQEDEYALGAIIGTTALALKSLKPEFSQKDAFAFAEKLWSERKLDLI
ncbi:MULTISPECIES: glycosyl transferase family protein [unclassified Oleiphilus]|nr:MULTISPECIES: glycosyl transferase family protein [unclassified Oleiphilus]KZY76372.1 glycosyl transferase [Oleiphilus sp. HI0068]KZY87753.1 glycosyl transferase [Oleiphilus sp. HI0072]KZZ25537.1 glycosyl transferase [Oleiphilus sp. HI0081]KZY29538.1 glycosyl transferase [Oleiphilus sp. HI0043]KZY58848.1 glycosyl transferase [Oleiphilus sp. HI0061]